MSVWPDRAEWERTTIEVLKREVRLPINTLCRIVARGVKAVRPDLERTHGQREAAAMLLEWCLPRIRRAERKRGKAS